MNEDRVIGEGKTMLGAGERSIGDVIGSDTLERRGVANQVRGAVQHGYGQIKDAANDLVESAPAVASKVADHVTGAVQHGYGRIKDTAHDLIEAAPAAAERVATQGRQLANRSDAAARRKLGDDGSLYLVFAAFTALGLAWFTSRREPTRTRRGRY